MDDDTKKDEATEPEEQPSQEFGTLVIRDDLVEVHRAPWNLPKDDPNWKPKPDA